MTKPQSDASSTGKTSKLFAERISDKSNKIVKDCVNSSPIGNMADIANEPSLHFSGSIAQSNQATVLHPFSIQTLNSRSNIKRPGQFEGNINLPVHEHQEPSCRTNVTNNAHIANNIMQKQQQPKFTPPSPKLSLACQLN